MTFTERKKDLALAGLIGAKNEEILARREPFTLESVQEAENSEE